jgi:hypothetical protein
MVIGSCVYVFFFFKNRGYFICSSFFFQTRDACDTHLRRLKAKSFMVSLSVEAMCVGRINVMNRVYQGRALNFRSYRTALQAALDDLEKIVAADAVSSWLRYRLELTSTGLARDFQLSNTDYATCKARTAVFVSAIVPVLKKRLPTLSIVAAFDVFDKEEMQKGMAVSDKYGEKEITELYEFYLQKRFPALRLSLLITQWNSWKSIGFLIFIRKHPEMDLVQMMHEVLKGGDAYETYPDIRELFAIALIQVFSNSIVESGYSVLNSLKNPTTNALADPTLDDPLNIIITDSLRCLFAFMSVC